MSQIFDIGPGFFSRKFRKYNLKKEEENCLFFEIK